MTTEVTTKKTDVKLLEKAEDYVRQLLAENLSAKVYFHDFEFTEIVKGAAAELAERAKLNLAETDILLLAALFHTAGRVRTQKQPWKESQRIASDFLRGHEVPTPTIAKVTALIGLLDPSSEPEDGLGQLFLDARFSYYGKKKFRRRMKRLRKQKELLEDNFQTDIDWQEAQLERLKKHIFYTSEAADLFGKRKKKNEKKARKRLIKMRKKQRQVLKASSVSANSGARTMFKTALRNHIDLTAIADQKANIMLSINALIFTIGLPAFSTYLSGRVYLLVPSILFLLTSITTMALATLATRPIKMDGETDMGKLKTGRTNLFFFGNFYNVSQKDYQRAIREIVADRDYLDTSFINDLYFLGLSLGDKYRRLRICYTVFFIGLVLSTLAFVVGYLFYK